MKLKEFKKLITECVNEVVAKNLFESTLVKEVDWQDKFSDVQKVCYTAESIADALNAELDRLKVPSTKGREKPDVSFPRISKGNIPTDEQGKANVEQFKKQLLQRPKTIFDKGEKSLHSTDKDKLTINTGIPALRAVIWDDDTNSFYVINTCPGAQGCIKNCYAMKGFYIMNDGKNIKLINRLQMMMSSPDEYEKLAMMEAERFAFEAKQQNQTLQIRWNDAGDFYSKAYFDIADRVTKELQKKGYKVESYIYTKLGKFVKLGTEAGMTMTFSSGATKKERDLVGDLSKVKTQITVPRELFKEFFTASGKAFEKNDMKMTKFKDAGGREKLKKKIVDHYNDTTDPHLKDLRGKLSIEKMKYTDELPASQGQPLEFDTITVPFGDSDAPAQRKDVRFQFLLEH